MPVVSKKGSYIPSSPIRKLAGLAARAKENGKKVYHLNIGQPDIETPEELLSAVRGSNFDVWSYTPSEGLPGYRESLSKYYRELGYPISADEILVTTGGSEAISMALTCCLDHEDELIVPEPFYANYNGFTAIAGVKIIPVQSFIENGFALPPTSEIESKITSRTKGIMICSPNNPTGYIYSKAELEALREIVIKYDLFLFCDEAYREFCYDGARFTSPMQLTGIEEHVVILDTISKRYSACGARIGAIITKNKEVYAAALRYAQARLCPPLLGQLAGEAASKVPASYFKMVVKEYEARRNLLVRRLSAMSDVFCTTPAGAFYVMARLPVADSDRFCQWLLQEFSLNNATVMFAPGTGFYSNPSLGLKEVRMAYVLNCDELEQAMLILKHGLLAYRNN